MCEHSKKLILWMDGELGASEAAQMEMHLRECAECRECLAAYQQASGAFEMYCDTVAGVAERGTNPKLAVFFQGDPNRVAEEPRAEGASRRLLSARLKPCPDDEAGADVQQGHGGLKPAATKARWVAVGAVAAAAIAMVLMLPRDHVAQIPAASTTSKAILHAVQRPANPEKAPERHILTAPAITNHAHRGADTVKHEEHAATRFRQKSESHSQMENANEAAAETPIEIAVPTEEMFPPGAVPAGIGFTAVVTLSADDAVQAAAIRPYRGASPGPNQGLSPNAGQGLPRNPRLTGYSNGGNR